MKRNILLLLTVLLVVALAFVSCDDSSDFDAETSIASIALTLGNQSYEKGLSKDASTIENEEELTWYLTLSNSKGSGYISYNNEEKENNTPFEIDIKSGHDLHLSYGTWTLVLEAKIGSRVVYSSNDGAETIVFNLNAKKLTARDIKKHGVGASISNSKLCIIVARPIGGDVSVFKGEIEGAETNIVSWYYSYDCDSWQNFETTATSIKAGQTIWVKVEVNSDPTTSATDQITDSIILYDNQTATVNGNFNSVTKRLSLDVVYKDILTYTVNFDTCGGSSVSSIKNVPDDTLITIPQNNPTKNGYVFAGWYYDNLCTDPWNFDTDTVLENMTLYAKWEEKKEIQYVSPTNILMTCTDYSLVLSSDKTWGKAGKTSWYLSEGTVEINSTVKCLGDVNLILAENSSLTINGSSYDAAVNVTDNNTLTVFSQQNSGYLYAYGGLYGAGIGGSEKISCGKITINGGNIVATGGESASSIGGGKDSTSAVDNVKVDSDFTLYVSDTSLFNNPITDNIPQKLFDNRICRLSSKNKCICTVNFYEKYEDETIHSTQTKYVLTGDAVEQVEDPVRENYKFEGWFEDQSSEVWNFDSPVTTNTNLYSKWLQKITVTVQDSTFTYDNTYKTFSEYSFSGDLKEGDSISVVTDGTGLHAGTYTNNVLSIRILRGSEDVSDEYLFGNHKPGKIVINKRKVTLTSGDAKKLYDGEPLTYNKITISGEGFASRDEGSYEMTGTITEVGTTSNTFKYSMNHGDPNDYQFEIKYGTLEVFSDYRYIDYRYKKGYSYTEREEFLTPTNGFIEITNKTPEVLSGSDFYVVSDYWSINHSLVCNGDVKILINDGCTLTVYGDSSKAAINVTDGNSLTIYGGPERTGHLRVIGGTGGAGIGGNIGQAGSNITIKGLKVTANGGSGADAIGSGSGGSVSSKIYITNAQITEIGNKADDLTAVFNKWDGIDSGKESQSDNNLAAVLNGKRYCTVDMLTYYDSNIKQYLKQKSFKYLADDTKDLKGWYAVIGNRETENLACKDNVKIVLMNGCNLKAEGSGSAAIRIDDDYGNNDKCSLCIYAETEDNDKAGILKAKGPSCYAAIGGNLRSYTRPISIFGGNITAEGGSSAAGIGGGSYGNAPLSSNETFSAAININIHGGNITAKGGSGGAGIGGGEKAFCEQVTITGGRVTAKGGSGGAGIGSGKNSRYAKDITIGGDAVVIAIGGGDAAGIGGGDGAEATNITIKDSADVTATGDDGAGIGGGEDGHASNINILGGTVTATGGSCGAGIGGGDNKYGSEITIRNAIVTARGGENAAGIGGGNEGGCTNIIIEGEETKLIAYGGGFGAGIGSGDEADDGGHNIEIRNGASVWAYGGIDAAGIGGGNESEGYDIEIYDKAYVNATGGGIPSGLSGEENGAGIGGGDEARGYNITILDSKVTATSGEGGCSIGSGADVDESERADCNIKIDGDFTVKLSNKLLKEPVLIEHETEEDITDKLVNRTDTIDTCYVFLPEN